MPKEWILNQANMRWGLTKKAKVGPVSELIRKCMPKTKEEWEQYYFQHGRKREDLENLGKILYKKISTICADEIKSITEDDCIDFIYNLVINRTYEGYQSEIQTIYKQIEEILGVKIEPAPDEWDRRYNVDYFIKVDDKFIGIQVKPAGYAYIPQIINELNRQKETHEKFAAKYGGKVFYIISVSDGNRKIIQNMEVIKEIKKEIERIKNLQKGIVK